LKKKDEDTTGLGQLYALAEANDIQVDSIKLNQVDALSLILEDYSCYIALNPSKLDGTADEKVKLAHELGHCMTGAFYLQHSPEDLRRKYEATANRWAVKKLVPLNRLKAALQAGYTEIWELAEHFEVPEWFMQQALQAWAWEIQQLPPGK
jgi:Zn-dependent peptidase ImmA (M78 family)